MTIYGYQCRECGQEYTSEHRGDVLIGEFCVCGTLAPIKRKYSLSVHRPMPRHFNATTQSEIGSEKQFDRELRDKGQKMEEQTGIPTQYERLDPEQAREAVRASGGAGLEETNRRRVNSGQPSIKI